MQIWSEIARLRARRFLHGPSVEQTDCTFKAFNLIVFFKLQRFRFLVQIFGIEMLQKFTMQVKRGSSLISCIVVTSGEVNELVAVIAEFFCSNWHTKK